jgi:flavin reductase (DIM6/NTAB) family NADH-FMN oxidoreductase RutF
MTVPVSEAAFREALAHFASGVTVVTASAPFGPVGFTASAFTSVSLAPPLVLVCVARRASAHDAVVAAEAFGVNVLSERQQWIAEQFARSGVDRFARVPLRAGRSGGAPLVEGAIVHLECRHHTSHAAGDHTILVGEVASASVAAGRPLVHYGRRFGAFTAEIAPRAAAAVEETRKAGEA